MAALPQPPRIETVDLGHVRGGEIVSLLREEVDVWRQRLYWDFRSSADLVERFVDMRALLGCGLRVDGELVGYSYYVCEEHKGLIGDLYVRHAHASPATERALLHATVHTVSRQPGVRRIESQLLMYRDTRPAGAYFPMASQVREFPRLFMLLDLTAIDFFPPGRASARFLLDRWEDRRSEEASQLISESYRQHIDAHINDQYRSVSGARRFLMNIVQYPGCGTFQEPASCIALDAVNRRFSGLCLTSIVCPGVGHITQLCTADSARGEGLGYEMLRYCLQNLRDLGCRSVTLTVTEDNLEAVRLYERFGFQVLKRFAAHVWEGFRY
ncbi:MAG: GNAT family N-acetyltransferase [Bryobacteraceae bacterium]|nr:GNAT family N-acetyltransferase [Bryobacteraceae bacterium]